MDVGHKALLLSSPWPGGRDARMEVTSITFSTARLGGAQVFEKSPDYAAFEKVLRQAWERTHMRLLAYVILPNHWHLVVWPEHDGDLSVYAQWLTVTHVRRWHAHHHTEGTGPVYQGRFRSFPVQADDHFFTLCRYVERNALRTTW